MPKRETILNEKMRGVAGTIYKTMPLFMPEDMLDFVFSGMISRDECIRAIMFDCMKYAYDETAEKHPLSYFIGGNNAPDDVRMKL